MISIIDFCFFNIKNDGVTSALLDLNWDELPIENKRDYQILLANSQNSLILAAGGLQAMPINLATFDKVYVSYCDGSHAA